jgi:hypothetical protein
MREREREVKVFLSPVIRLGFNNRLGFGADMLLDAPVSEVAYEGTYQERLAWLDIYIHLYFIQPGEPRLFPS